MNGINPAEAAFYHAGEQVRFRLDYALSWAQMQEPVMLKLDDSEHMYIAQMGFSQRLLDRGFVDGSPVILNTLFGISPRREIIDISSRFFDPLRTDGSVDALLFPLAFDKDAYSPNYIIH
jgi:hypothetical protein